MLGKDDTQQTNCKHYKGAVSHVFHEWNPTIARAPDEQAKMVFRVMWFSQALLTKERIPLGGAESIKKCRKALRRVLYKTQCRIKLFFVATQCLRETVTHVLFFILLLKNLLVKSAL